VTVETEEETVLRGSQERRSSLTWCPACRREAEMVTPEQAVQIADVSLRTIYRWIEAGSIHFIEGRDRSTLICLDSLSSQQTQETECFNPD